MRPERDLLRIGLTLRLDAVAAELTRALGQQGIRSLIFRGPALKAALYSDDAFRAYDDVDLLVDLNDLHRTRSLLADRGYSPAVESDETQPWVRDDGVTVDLHSTIVGIGAPAAAVWDELTAGSSRLSLGAQEVEIPGEPALAFIIALHAAQHGSSAGKAISDLERGLSRFSRETWVSAAALAERLQAVPAFAAGLGLVDAGADVARELQLPTVRTEEVALRAASAPPIAIGLQRLAATPGLANKARMLRREVAPTAVFMRAKYPLARRGSVGLAASYVWRPLWLLGHLGPAIIARRRARRQIR
jgi:hypothetical protein